MCSSYFTWLDAMLAKGIDNYQAFGMNSVCVLLSGGVESMEGGRIMWRE